MIPLRWTMIFLLCLPAGTGCAQTPAEVIDKMIAASQRVKTLKYHLVFMERKRNGEMALGEMDVKLQRSPFSVYLYLTKPGKGAEILYVRGSKALVNPHVFPYITWTLDPNSPLMRRGKHHSLDECGFDYIAGMLQKSLLEDRIGFNQRSRVQPILYRQKKCIQVTIDHPGFGYIDYRVKAGEDLIRIARQQHIGEYMILCANKDISSYQDVRAGEVIRLPNSYSRRLVLIIDEGNALPVAIINHDDKGLYEQYEFESLEVNPAIDPAEFTPGWRGYHF